MSLASELEALTGCSMRWRDSGTPAGRSWWVLDMSKHRTGATGSGLSLPTPIKSDVDRGKVGLKTMTKDRRGRRLREVLTSALPTPTAQEYGSNQGGAAGRAGLKRPSLRYLLTPTKTGNLTALSMDKWAGARALRSLMTSLGASGTPALARIYGWMMGYPPGWLDDRWQRTEMPLCRRSSRR